MSGAILQFPLYTFIARTRENLPLLAFILKSSASAFIQADAAERDHTGATTPVTCDRQTDRQMACCA